MAGEFKNLLRQTIETREAEQEAERQRQTDEWRAGLEARRPDFRAAHLEAWTSQLETQVIEAAAVGRTTAELIETTSDKTTSVLTREVMGEIADHFREEGCEAALSHWDNGHFASFMGEMEGPYVPPTQFSNTIRLTWDNK